MAESSYEIIEIIDLSSIDLYGCSKLSLQSDPLDDEACC